jgi:lipoprotein-releasing system ATP-binding protein
MLSRAMLEVTDVTRDYPDPAGGAPVAVLRGVSFRLAAGEAAAIVGPSGSGKSTLLNIVGALDTPSRGMVRLDGRDLATLDEAGRAALRNRRIGYVFQLHHLLPQCSALENVMIPTLVRPAKLTQDEARARADYLLERVGLKHRRTHRPGQLSGGECQRVAVARALINRPTLLLADEPTGSLDRAASDDIGQLLADINRDENVALLVVTHAAPLAARFARVLSLQNGSLALTDVGPVSPPVSPAPVSPPVGATPVSSPVARETRAATPGT